MDGSKMNLSLRRMKVLVTGGCGFIGHHLVNRLLQDKHEVIVFDRMDHCSDTKYFCTVAFLSIVLLTI